MAVGLIPGGRQELSEAIQGMGESANLENQRNLADRNLEQMRRAQYMNVGGNLAGIAVAKGAPMALKWLKGGNPITAADTAATSEAINSGAIGGNIMGTPASELAGNQFAPVTSFASPAGGGTPMAIGANALPAAETGTSAVASALPIGEAVAAPVLGMEAGTTAALGSFLPVAEVGAAAVPEVAAAGMAGAGAAAEAAGMSIAEFLPLLLGIF